MSSLHTNTIIYIGSHRVSSFNHLQIEQNIAGHHSFELVMSQDWFNKNEDGLFGQVKELIGMQVVIEIKPEQYGKKDMLLFEGIITNLSTGKEDNGNTGFCTITGYSPTILLDDDLDIQTYEDKDQGHILKDRLGRYPQNLLQYVIDPISTSSIGYVVQYKENTWQFIRRLASTQGEWCFYDGMKLIYGKHSPQEIKLSHNRDLSSFSLNMGIRPGNQKLHSYEYENTKLAESDTKSQRIGTLNQISDHLMTLSDSLYLQQGLVKTNHYINNSAQEHIKQLALMQRKSRIAQMVYARGESTNITLKIGMVVNIVEDFQTSADHGKYFITGLTHVCTGDGNYSNYFNSIPSDVAAPSYYPDLHTFCEAQPAVVVENYDEKGLGRVRVRFQWQQYGTSPWIRVLSASGGGDKGFYFIPEKGEEVLVDFEGGNPELPYVVGSTYHGKGKTSFGNKDNDLKVIKTRSGHTIEFNDAGGGTSILIKDVNGNIILLDTQGKSITITAPETLTFNAKNVKFNVDEDFVTNVGSNMKTTIGASNKHTVTEKFEFSSASIKETIEGDRTTDIKGDFVMKTAMTKITSSDGDITIKSAGIATLQGKIDAKVNKG